MEARLSNDNKAPLQSQKDREGQPGRKVICEHVHHDALLFAVIVLYLRILRRLIGKRTKTSSCTLSETVVQISLVRHGRQL
jgi:hypothetical protein